jgi:CBS domain-containing protein
MRTLSEIVFNQNPLTLPPNATVKEACREMCERRVGSVLVVDEAGCLVGIFTGRDAVRRVLAVGMNARTKICDVMTPKPDVVSPDLTAIDALRLMWDGGYRHLPVVKDGEVLGVASRGDFKAGEQARLDDERSIWEHIR